jgi:hypothetical protein
MLETEGSGMINLAKARARARAVVTTMNHDRAPRPTFSRASQNVVATTALLDTLPTPSSDGADKVYLQLKGTLSVTAMQKAESSLQRRAKISISSPGHSKAS